MLCRFSEHVVKYCLICCFLLLVINAAERNSDESLPVCLRSDSLRNTALK